MFTKHSQRGQQLEVTGLKKIAVLFDHSLPNFAKVGSNAALSPALLPGVSFGECFCIQRLAPAPRLSPLP